MSKIVFVPLKGQLGDVILQNHMENTKDNISDINIIPETKFRVANYALVTVIGLMIILRVLALINIIIAYPSQGSTSLKVIAMLVIIISVVVIYLFYWLIRKILKFEKYAYRLLIAFAVFYFLSSAYIKDATSVILVLVTYILTFFIMIGLSPKSERRVFLVKDEGVKKPPIWLKTFFIILVIFGLFLILGSIISIYQTYAGKTERTEGQVIGSRVVESSHNSHVTYTTYSNISFADKKGESIQFENHVISHIPKTGDIVNVIYDPQDPKNATVNDGIYLWITQVLTVLCFSIIISACFLRLSGYRLSLFWIHE